MRYEALRGVELVGGVARLCAMNLFLHGSGPDDDTRKPPIRGGDDSLRKVPSDSVDVVLTNPPFGRKSCITVVNDEATPTARRSATTGRTSGRRATSS